MRDLISRGQLLACLRNHQSKGQQARVITTGERILLPIEQGHDYQIVYLLSVKLAIKNTLQGNVNHEIKLFIQIRAARMLL